jgi:predicted GNAT family acetyltransferase
MPILDGDADLGDVRVFLRREPVLNTVPLGLVSRAVTSADERAKLFVATVERAGEIVAAALRADFPKMALAATGTQSELVDLAGLVYSRMPDLPCVLGRDLQVAAFAAEWEGLTGRHGRAGARQRVHVLDRVREMPDVPGTMRTAQDDNFDLVLDWFGAFEDEALPAQARSDRGRREAVRRNIEAESIFLWMDPRPVSLAGAREFGEGVARIGPVFTPPGCRRQGYGGALTASVSQHMIGRGCTACCLFTDLGNPTSNHIYREVGYQPLADFNEFWFESD